MRSRVRVHVVQDKWSARVVNESTLRRLDSDANADYLLTKLYIWSWSCRNARATYSKSVLSNNRRYNILRRWNGYYRKIAVLQRSSDLGRSIWLGTAFTLLRSLSELMHRSISRRKDARKTRPWRSAVPELKNWKLHETRQIQLSQRSFFILRHWTAIWQKIYKLTCRITV